MLRSVVRLAAFRIAASERTPPAAANSRCSTVSSLRSITCATSLTTSGDVCPMVAIRIATSAWSSGASSSITLAARPVLGSWAITSATVCGCSLRRKAAIWSGGVLRRNSNGVVSMINREAGSGSRSRVWRRLELLEHLAGESAGRPRRCSRGRSPSPPSPRSTAVGVLGLDGGRARHLDRQLLDHLSCGR